MKAISKLTISILILIISGYILKSIYFPSWTQLNKSLWIDSAGNIGFKAYRETLFGDYEFFIITLFIEDKNGDTCNSTLKDIIDIKSFQSVGSFFKDKNYVYLYYDTSSGGFLKVLKEIDSATFEQLCGLYAKDRKNIYVSRHGKLDADYETFMALHNESDNYCYSAKDKNGYFDFDKRRE